MALTGSPTRFTIKVMVRSSLTFSILSIALSSAAFADAEAPPASDTSQNSTKVPAALVQLIDSHYYSPYAFLVDKKARQLSVWQNDHDSFKKIAEYPADLGKNEGEKRQRDDQKTPTGIYFLERKLEGNGLDHKLYGDRAFTTNYPNFFDRMLGKSGSGIWFHAVPDTVPLTRGSKGCVVVRNNVIREVTQYVRLAKTPIIIEDEMEWTTPEELKKTSASLLGVIENWRAAWQSKNIEDYIAFYSDEFKSLGMNRDKWKKYKSGVNENNGKIDVRFSRPLIFAYKDFAIARVLQNYTSQEHEDFGEKQLYFKRVGDTYKIVGEEWATENDAMAKTEIIGSGQATN